MKIPPSIGLTCSDFTDIPNSFETNGDLDYGNPDTGTRQWELYINNEYYGVTGDEFEYMEELVDTHPDLSGSYGDGLIIINESVNPISLAFVATVGNIENDENFSPKFPNESLQYDLEAGIMKFCLSGMSNE